MYFLQDALDSPLIENDYASVNDALPEGQLQRIKSTQRKAKGKNKLKTGIFRSTTSLKHIFSSKTCL